MKQYQISVNQFAEFSKATFKGKKRILKQQLVANKLLVPWYQSARAAMKKYLKDVSNLTPINEAIDKLTTKTPSTKRQQDEKIASVAALNELKSFAFPKLLREVEFTILKPYRNYFTLNNLDIIVAPDVVLKGKYNGKIIVGAVKVHICKTKPFDDKQGKYVSNLIYRFLQKNITENEGEVLPELCLCIDIFSGRITPATEVTNKEKSEIKSICEEVKNMWAA